MCALVTGVQTCALPICALIKNAEALERFAAVDTLIVDKTGTLTLGKPALVAVLPEAGVDEDELLSLAASLERGSEHPLAEAIVAGRSERGVALAKAEGFEEIKIVRAWCMERWYQ